VVMLAVVQGPRTLSGRHKQVHAGASGSHVPRRELRGGGAAGPGGDGAAGAPSRQRAGRPAGQRAGGRAAAAPRARAPRRLARARHRPAQPAVRPRMLQGAPARLQERFCKSALASALLQVRSRNGGSRTFNRRHAGSTVPAADATNTTCMPASSLRQAWVLICCWRGQGRQGRRGQGGAVGRHDPQGADWPALRGGCSGGDERGGCNRHGRRVARGDRVRQPGARCRPGRRQRGARPGLHGGQAQASRRRACSRRRRRRWRGGRGGARAGGPACAAGRGPGRPLGVPAAPAGLHLLVRPWPRVPGVHASRCQVTSLTRMACMSDRGKQDAGTVLLVPLPGACEAAPVSAALYLKATDHGVCVCSAPACFHASVRYAAGTCCTPAQCSARIK